jgi:hypothetical protein
VGPARGEPDRVGLDDERVVEEDLEDARVGITQHAIDELASPGAREALPLAEREIRTPRDRRGDRRPVRRRLRGQEQPHEQHVVSRARRRVDRRAAFVAEELAIEQPGERQQRDVVGAARGRAADELAGDGGRLFDGERTQSFGEHRLAHLGLRERRELLRQRWHLGSSAHAC